MALWSRLRCKSGAAFKGGQALSLTISLKAFAEREKTPALCLGDLQLPFASQPADGLHHEVAVDLDGLDELGDGERSFLVEGVPDFTRRVSNLVNEGCSLDGHAVLLAGGGMGWG